MFRFQNVCENYVQVLEEEKHRQLCSLSFVRYLLKKVRETGILIDKPKPRKAENSAYTRRILLLWQKVYVVKRHQHQFTVVLNS